MARRSRRRQKGTGEVLQPAPGVWAIRWREGNRRHYRSGFADWETADKVLAKVRGEIALARAGMPSDSRVTHPVRTRLRLYRRSSEKRLRP